MPNRKSLIVLALVLGAVACERAAAPGTPNSSAPPAEPRAYSSTGNVTTATGSPAIATASVRRQVPGLWFARGVATTNAVHITVRRNSSVLGFQTINSGTLIVEDEGTGSIEIPFGTDAGYRYLIVAMPVQNGVADESRAAFVEITT